MMFTYNMHKNLNKGISTPVGILIIVLVAVILGGGILAWQYLGVPENLISIPTPIPEETAGWIGTYEYSEFAPSDFGSNQTWVYKLEIYKEGEKFKAKFDIDGFQTSRRIQAIAKENNGNLDIIFDEYLPEDIHYSELYQKGDLLFSLQKVSDENYKIIWNKLTSNLLNPGNAIFKKIQDETANWQTYSNEQYGFEIKYPADTQCGEFNDNGSGYFFFGRIEIGVLDSGELDLNSFVDNYLSQNSAIFNIIDSKTQVNLNAGNAIKVEYHFGGPNRYGEMTFLENNLNIYAIGFTAGGFTCDEPQIFPQMLSTFKFLEYPTPNDEGLDKFILLSPNGGEILELGHNYRVKWSSEGIPEDNIEGIAIFLANTESSPWVMTPIVKNINPSSGSYLWTISGFTKVGSVYKILITASLKGVTKMGLTDETDGVFSTTAE